MGMHILSNSEIVVIWGSNCPECSLIVQQYVKFLFSEKSEIKKMTFQVNGTEVKFTFSKF